MEASWSAVKNMLVSRGVSAQYAIVGSNYWIKAIDGAFQLECFIPQDESVSSDTADFVANFLPAANKPPIQNTSVSSQPTPPPFSAKTVVSGSTVKKIYKRTTGIQAAVFVAAPTTILFTIPYAWCKITGASIINGEALDTIDLYVLDTSTGSYSTVPNMVLNQFGFSVNIVAGNFQNTSPYDADLYQNMQLKIVYTSKSDKTIGINLDLHEVK